MKENYLPFFRKYRPQSLNDLVGQDNLVKMLTSAIELNKIAHAYLFCGPRGTGKTSTARILAKSLNCEKGPTVSPCQTCPSCVDITNASGLDVIEIDAATNGGVDNARELIAQTNYAPMNGKYKIFIIDEVHMLSSQAFNALLKTLEEPPQNVIFILATTEPQDVLETIVSRCQRYDFRRITLDDIVKKLREVSDLENIKIKDDALFEIAKNVSGGLRDSLALLDQVSILGQKNEITKEDIQDILGKITFSLLFDFINFAYNKNFEKSFELLNDIYAKGSEPRNFIENLIEFLRNVYAIINAKNTDILKYINLNQDEYNKIKSSNFESGKIALFIDKTLEFYRDIKVSTNPYLISEILVVDLCNLENDFAQKISVAKTSAVPISSMPTSAQTPVASAPEPTPIKPSAPAPKPMPEPVEVKNVDTNKIVEVENEPLNKEANENIAKVKENTKNQTSVEIEQVAPQKNMAEEPAQTTSNPSYVWGQIISSIESIPAKCFFKDEKVARLVGIDDNSISIALMYDSALDTAKSPMRFNPLKKAVDNVFEQPHEIRFVKFSSDMKTIQPEKIAQPKPKPAIQNDESNEPLNISTPNINIGEEEQAEMQIYSGKTKEMLESFSGKVID